MRFASTAASFPSLADLNLFQVMGFRSTKREEKASSPLSEEKGESDLTSCSIPLSLKGEG
jgi:hypothetical protein